MLPKRVLSTRTGLGTQAAIVMQPPELKQNAVATATAKHSKWQAQKPGQLRTACCDVFTACRCVRSEALERRKWHAHVAMSPTFLFSQRLPTICQNRTCRLVPHTPYKPDMWSHYRTVHQCKKLCTWRLNFSLMCLTQTVVILWNGQASFVTQWLGKAKST